jgi:hypothetical protein
MKRSEIVSALAALFVAPTVSVADDTVGAVPGPTAQVDFQAKAPCRVATESEFEAFGPRLGNQLPGNGRGRLRIKVYAKGFVTELVAASEDDNIIFDGPGKIVIKNPDGSDPHYFVIDTTDQFNLVAVIQGTAVTRILCA